MHKSCKRKCIPNFDSNVLSRSEENCFDRCTFKYLEANEILSKILQEQQIKK